MVAADVAKAKLEAWRRHPDVMVRELFGIEPDAWQLDVLQAFPQHNRLCMVACKGPGKTATDAWLCWNYLLTRQDAQIAATSISGDNLRDGLWKELAFWQSKSPLLKALFEWSAERVVSRERPATWWASARKWSKSANPTQQAQTLAGLHAKYMMFLIDEASGVPMGVVAAAEAVLSGGAKAKLVLSGNPESKTGPLYRAAVIDRALWFVVRVTGDPDDPKRSPRVDLEWARQLIASYGRDNPWVMVNVLGEFPPAAFNALLSVEEVEAAMRRHLKRDRFEWAQRRLGIDVARFGDDRTVIFPRQGPVAFKPIVMRHARDESVSVMIANRVAHAKAQWGSELELMDATGGWGAGARDVLVATGIPVHQVQFGAPARERDVYANQRAEIWFAMAKWIREGGVLPNLPEIVGELTEPTYVYSPKGQIQVEPKKLVKERIGRSPDLADALAVTFGYPEQPGASGQAAIVEALGSRKALHDWDPYQTTE